MPSTNKVIDTSALTAIILDEPIATVVAARLRADGVYMVASPSLVELRIVLAGRYARDAERDVEILRERMAFEVVPFTEAHSKAAFQAWLRYGKGRHPAALNFGDCISYAAAKVARAELIYVGDDFARTDLA